jgi:hypothetical protein
MEIVNMRGYGSVAFPIIGSGSGSRCREKALSFMLEAFDAMESRASVKVVKHKKPS